MCVMKQVKSTSKYFMLMSIIKYSIAEQQTYSVSWCVSSNIKERPLVSYKDVCKACKIFPPISLLGEKWQVTENYKN